MVNIEDLIFYLSGGTGNFDGNLSTGGDKGNRLDSMSIFLNDSLIDGITVVEAYGFNNNAVITVSYDNTTDTVSVTSNDSNINDSAVITTDDIITLKDTDKEAYVILDINFALAEASVNTTSNYTLVDNLQSLFTDITPAQAETGYTDYRVIYLHNEGAFDATNLTFYTEKANGVDTIEIAVGTVETLITDTGDRTVDPLGGGSYASHATYAGGLNAGTLLAGNFIPLVIKRTVPVNVTQYSNNNLIIVAAAD